MKHLIVAAALMVAAALAVVRCPIDDSGAYRTGKFEQPSGRLMFEYRCTGQGHLFWVRAS